MRYFRTICSITSLFLILFSFHFHMRLTLFVFSYSGDVSEQTHSPILSHFLLFLLELCAREGHF